MKDKHLIITIHGIHTHADKSWQNKFKKWCNKKYPGITVLDYTYGWLAAPFSWWITLTRVLKIPSFLRKHYIGGFQNYLLKIRKQYPDHKISIISHSFGTWVSYYALNREPELKIHNLILVQGVISSHVEKLDILSWLQRKRVNAVFAWSSHEDSIVCSVAIPPFGKVGCRGFVRYGNNEDYQFPDLMPYNENLFNQYHTALEHSDIWQRENTWDYLIYQVKYNDEPIQM